MTELFNKCIQVILEHEGGYVDDPDDLGGETKYGIAKRFFPNEDIKNLTVERAKEIYWEKYWQPMKLDSIDDEASALELFDMGVNAGIRNATKMAQNIVNAIPDGDLGPKTIIAINSYGNNFVTEYKESRRMYYVDITINRPANIKFLKGWLKRVYNTKFK
jgi:lysozyme family protein